MVDWDFFRIFASWSDLYRQGSACRETVTPSKQEMEKLVVHNDEFFAQVVAQLENGKRVTIPVKGVSMLPFIRGERDLVELTAPDRTQLKRDDIVLFRTHGRWIMHRILKIENGIATIQGDGVWRGKEVVSVNQIHGKAVSILRKGVSPRDPYRPGELRLVHAWQRLGGLRRYILAIYRRLFRIRITVEKANV